jgi:GT2 family glycosyltransferase
MPLVSVIIPTYNRADHIGEAIRSVQAQTHRDVEIIVADDGSIDNTADIVGQFGDSVIYIPLPHRGQPAAARNVGLGVARGQLIAFLDSDDLFMPDKLALQLSAFDIHPEAGLIYSNGHFFRDDPRQATGYALDGLPAPSGDVLPELLQGNFIASPAVALIRRSCLDAVKGFDENPSFVAVEDYDLWLRIAARFPIIYVPGDVAAIRRHKQSISGDAKTHRARALLVLAKLEAMRPDLARRHRAALNEGYARHHGAIVLAQLEERQLLLALPHAIRALRYSLGTSGFGTRALRDYLQRRRVRGRAALP